VEHSKLQKGEADWLSGRSSGLSDILNYSNKLNVVVMMMAFMGLFIFLHPQRAFQYWPASDINSIYLVPYFFRRYRVVLYTQEEIFFL